MHEPTPMKPASPEQAVFAEALQRAMPEARAEYLEGGCGVVTASLDRTARVWDAPPAPTPVPPWFLALAEAVAGTRLSARGNIELVSRKEREEAVRQLVRVSDGDFYERLGRWFLADPSKRPESPF